MISGSLVTEAVIELDDPQVARVVRHAARIDLKTRHQEPSMSYNLKFDSRCEGDQGRRGEETSTLAIKIWR
jgi:hypothetical protein